MGNTIFLPKVDSTNNYAATLLAGSLAQAPTAIMTFQQEAGRGQRGNSWSCEPGKDLAISFICNPNIAIREMVNWNLLLAVWTADYLVHHLSIEAIKVKWPNDIYYQDKKLGGILIENQFSGKQIASSVFGFGLNINSSANASYCSVSLKEIAGRPVDIHSFANDLAENFKAFHKEFIRYPFENWHINRYYQYMYGFQSTRTFSDSKRGAFNARILGVDDNGRIILDSNQFGKLYYDIKELQWHF